MNNKKTPEGNQELEPIWTNSNVAKPATELYKICRQQIDEDREKGLGILLQDFCVLQSRLHQREETFAINQRVSSRAAEVSHQTVEKYQQFEATLKTQGKNLSKRLEELEYNGF